MPVIGDLQLENLARSLHIVLLDDLVVCLDDVQQEWVPKDAAYYALLGQPVPPTPLDPPAYWAVGHHPSILDRPLDEFPNVTIHAYDHRSAGDLGADQWDPLTCRAWVEIFVSHTDVATVNRMAYRYAQALNRCLVQNSTLGGLVETFDFSPDVQISNVADRYASEDNDQIVFLQGAQLDYGFRINPEPW